MGRLTGETVILLRKTMFPMIPPQVNGATPFADDPTDRMFGRVSNDSAPS